METKQATSDKTSDKGKRLIYAEDLFEPPVKPIMVIGGRSGGKTAAMDEQIFRKRVEMAPTVDAAPVVHGQMEEIEPCQITVDRQCCSCGTAMGSEDNYCPNCGAKMDGGASGG